MSEHEVAEIVGLNLRFVSVHCHLEGYGHDSITVDEPMQLCLVAQDFFYHCDDALHVHEVHLEDLDIGTWDVGFDLADGGLALLYIP